MILLCQLQISTNNTFHFIDFILAMSKAQAESVIKNIIREIAQECATQGQAVSETLVAFIVSLNQ